MGAVVMTEVLRAYRRDVKNKNDERLLSFAAGCKLALTNTFFSPRKGGISHTHTSARQNDRKRIEYILTRQVRRPSVHYVEVHSQPPSRDKPDSGHNTMYVTVDLGGRCAPNRQVRKALKYRPLDGQFVFVRRGVSYASICKNRIRSQAPTQPKTMSDVADVSPWPPSMQ